jgi:Cu/Ag efflux pump CusA
MRTYYGMMCSYSIWSVGAGADVMRRIAAPMIGGILTSFILELPVYPALYEVWKLNTDVRRVAQQELRGGG